MEPDLESVPQFLTSSLTVSLHNIEVFRPNSLHNNVVFRPNSHKDRQKIKSNLI